MTKFKVTYSKEFSKIIYARNREEAIWKFNRNADDNSQYVSADEVEDDKTK